MKSSEYKEFKNENLKWFITGMIILVLVPYSLIALPISKSIGYKIRTMMESIIETTIESSKKRTSSRKLILLAK